MKYQDIHVVMTHQEAEQFRYKHNDQPVDIGTPVAYDAIRYEHGTGDIQSIDMICLGGIYFDDTCDTNEPNSPGQIFLNWPSDFDGAHHIKR